jgi:hypothetical protein
VDSGEAVALVSAFPGVVVHEPLAVELPSEDAEGIVPVALPAIEPMILTGAAGGRLGKALAPAVISAALDPGMVMTPVGVVIAPGGFTVAVGLGETVVAVDVTLITEGESSTNIGEQLTLVPGIVGSWASGGEARVVAGAPGTVAAEKRLENGPGPPSGDDTIAPGVVGSDMAVLPIVDTCA